MTAKEGFYFLLKVNQEGLTENAIRNNNNQTLNLRWFDLYINLFDKANYEYYKKDEFKWPDYSKKIVNEINHGIESSDFDKLYSYRNKETLGKYNFELGGFPITRTGSDITIFSDDHISFKVTLRLGYWVNSKDIDLFLKIDPKKGEKLVESIGQNRKVDVKVIYNVVDRNMTNLNQWDEKYLGIFVHKLIFMNGSEVLGEINSPPALVYKTVGNTTPKTHLSLSDSTALADSLSAVAASYQFNEPESDKIKRDLLGQKIYNNSGRYWSFDNLEEFKKFDILSSSVSSDFCELNIDMNLYDKNTHETFKANVIVRYTKSSNTWIFQNVKAKFFEKV
jgi:hypothetical protein